MPEDILQQVMDEYGLLGFILAAFILGPGLVYVQMRQSKVKNEVNAQALISELLLEEHHHADELENELNQTTQKLLEAKEEVFRLKMALVESQGKVNGMPEVSEEMEAVTQRLNHLEGQMLVLHDQLQQLVTNGNTRGLLTHLQRLMETGVGTLTPAQAETD